MGEEATERTATDDEVARMVTLVREAMAAGAVGFASSTAEAHNGEGGTPMPSRLADDRELRALVRAMGDSGRGVYMLTKGSKTSIPYLEELAVEARRPVVIAALFHSNTNPTAAFTWLDQVNAARSRGHQLVAQTSCCPLSMDFTFKSPYLFESMEAWKPAMAAHDPAGLEKVYRDPAWRAAVRNELTAKHGRLLFNGEWDKLFIVETAKAENQKMEGAPLAALAKQAGKDPLDFILDFALSEKLDTTFVAQLLHNDEKAVGRILADPNTHISLERRRRPSHFLLRRRFRPAPDGPLEPRPRRARPAASRASPHGSAGQAVWPQRPRPAARGLCRRPDAVRSRDGGARSQAPRPRSPLRCRPPHHLGRRPAGRLDQRHQDGRRKGLLHRPERSAGRSAAEFRCIACPISTGSCWPPGSLRFIVGQNAARVAMSYRLLPLVAATALAGCAVTADVYGVVGDRDDLYTGTATGYVSRTGTIELKNVKGNRCSGDFAYYPGVLEGRGTIGCDDGQRVTLRAATPSALSSSLRALPSGGTLSM